MNQVGSGLRWNALNSMIGQSANLIRLLLVAASTGPTVAGKYAIATVIVGGAAILTEVGFRQQYIATPLESEPAFTHHRLSVAWLLNLCLRILVVGAVLALFAGNQYLAIAANDTLFAALVLSVSSTLAAASNPMLLERERLGDFRPNTICESGGQLFGMALLLALLPTHASLELLVLSQLAATATQAAISYTLVPARRLTTMRVLDLITMARDGRPFMLIAIMTYATYSLDKPILGWLADTDTVGTYYVAQRLAEIPIVAFTAVVGRTLLPAYLKTGSARDGVLFAKVRGHTRILFTLFMPIYLMTLAILYANWTAALIPNWVDTRLLISLLLIAAVFRVGCHLIAPAMIIRNDVTTDAKFKVQEAALHVPLLVISIWQLGAIGAALSAIIIYTVSWWRRYRFVAHYGSSATSFPT